MSIRIPAAAFTVAMALLGLAPGVNAQTKSATAAKPYAPPRTPWGDPDLQGMWPSGSMTGVPFQRPESFGERRELTDEEFARREEAVDAQRTGSFVIGAWGEPGKAQRQTSLIVEPENGRLPELTPEGVRRSAFLRSSWQNIWFDNVSDFDTWDRCITRGLLPSMLPAQYSNGIQIHQSPGYLVIRNEMIHENRVIPTDGRPHAGSRVSSYMGDSKGHWEGNTLVIDTTNFNGKTAATNPGTSGSPQQNNIPTSEHMKIVERLTRISPDTIQYEATVTDPTVFAAPYKVSYPLKNEPDYQMFEYSCHDGNYALANLITGSQADRKKVMEATAVLPAAISEPVKTDAGLISGTLGSAAGVRVYKGIPFAAPPVGELRWRAPQPVVKWDGVKKGDIFGNVCVQPKGNGRLNVSVDLPDSPKASEDCLYLNVWTAAASASERRPVMVWIFGGAYTEGAGSSPHNDGEALARKGVVAVTFNYRLGPFGFFSHPDLTKESGRNASGNQAMMDALAALRWVQTNIAAFGGDPRNVTIFGESAGSSMSAGLVGSPEAKGLFQHAVSESGAFMGLSMSTMRTRAQAEIPSAGRRGGPAPPLLPLAELRAKPTEEVSRTLFGAGMIADGWIIPEDLSITFAEGRQNAVDVLVGSNKDEGSFAGNTTAMAWTGRVRQRWGDLADDYLKLYPAGSDADANASSQLAFRDEMAWHMRLYADLQTRRGRRAYWYFFTHEPPVEPGARDLKSTHTAEIPYVFNNLKPPRVFPDASSPALASASARDQALAEVVSSHWVNFAKNGDPNGKGLPTWPAFKDVASSRPMIIGDIKDMPDTERLNIYDRLYARQMAALK